MLVLLKTKSAIIRLKGLTTALAFIAHGLDEAATAKHRRYAEAPSDQYR